MPLYRRLPKRGFKPLTNNLTAILNLSKIQIMIEKKDNKLENTLDLKILKSKKIINKKYTKLKILGSGQSREKLEITANFASKQALEKVEKAGGKINIIKK